MSKINEDVIKLVVARISLMPPTVKLSIGGAGSYTKGQLIKHIEDGDYIIVDTKKQPQSGSYVLAIIDNCANIKKLLLNSKNKIISLISESTENHPTIFIHENDKFLINGVVKYIIKKPVVS